MNSEFKVLVDILPNPRDATVYRVAVIPIGYVGKNAQAVVCDSLNQFAIRAHELGLRPDEIEAVKEAAAGFFEFRVHLTPKQILRFSTTEPQ